MFDRDKLNSDTPRVLLFSQRNIYEPEVWRGAVYELEEILRQIDRVEVISPRPEKWFKQRRSNAQRIGKYTGIILNPGIRKTRLNKYYDLFFAVCEKPTELLNIDAVEGWRDHCKTSVCWLTELWVKEMPLYKSALRVLSKFDYVFLTYSQSVDPVQKVVETECSFLPPGVDSLFFCPYPDPSERLIDVLSMGRRQEHVHRVLLNMVKEKKLFYVFDTFHDMHTDNVEQHRLLMSNILKRSKILLVNPGKFDQPNESGNQSEMGFRYFEGMASGAIMAGSEPRNDEFKKIFSWPDAVVRLPSDPEDVGEVIGELRRDLNREAGIRKSNVMHSLLHHDWVYRWERVLKTAGLEPTSELLKRKTKLQDLARMVENESKSGRESQRVVC